MKEQTALASDSTVRLGRRRMLQGMGAVSLTLAGGSLLAGCSSQVAPFFSATAERRLETTQIRIGQVGSVCHAPQFVAQDMMRAEGLTDVQYVKVASLSDLEAGFASGDIQLGMHFAAPIAVRVDAGDPVVALAGVHVGCFELFGTNQVHTIRDLKGKTVAVPDVRTGPYTFVAGMLAYVGLNPREDVTWVTLPGAEAKQRLADGTIDA